MSFSNPLYDDITYLKGVGPKRAKQLKLYGIEIIIDVLYHIPRKYLDRTNIKMINQTKIGEQAVVIGKVVSKNMKILGKRRLFQVTISDGTGELQCIWFNSLSWIIEKFKINDQVAAFGKIEFYNGLKITHPDFDILDESENYNTGQIISQYSSTADLKSKGLDSRGFRKLVKNIISNPKYMIEDFLPLPILNEENLITLKDAFVALYCILRYRFFD